MRSACAPRSSVGLGTPPHRSNSVVSFSAATKLKIEHNGLTNRSQFEPLLRVTWRHCYNFCSSKKFPQTLTSAYACNSMLAFRVVFLKFYFYLTIVFFILMHVDECHTDGVHEHSCCLATNSRLLLMSGPLGLQGAHRPFYASLTWWLHGTSELLLLGSCAPLWALHCATFLPRTQQGPLPSTCTMRANSDVPSWKTLPGKEQSMFKHMMVRLSDLQHDC